MVMVRKNVGLILICLQKFFVSSELNCVLLSLTSISSVPKRLKISFRKEIVIADVGGVFVKYAFPPI